MTKQPEPRTCSVQNSARSPGANSKVLARHARVIPADHLALPTPGPISGAGPGLSRLVSLAPQRNERAYPHPSMRAAACFLRATGGATNGSIPSLRPRLSPDPPRRPPAKGGPPMPTITVTMSVSDDGQPRFASGPKCRARRRSARAAAASAGRGDQVASERASPVAHAGGRW